MEAFLDLDGVAEDLNAIILDENLHILATGQSFIPAGFGAHVAFGRLSTGSQHKDAALRSCIAKGVQGAVPLSKASDHDQVTLIILPTVPLTGETYRQGIALFRSRQTTQDNLTHVMRAFDLTAAEISVLRLIAKGQNTITAAKSLNLAPSTVRTHLSHIFEKTLTRRQSELVYLVSTFSGRNDPLGRQQARASESVQAVIDLAC